MPTGFWNDFRRFFIRGLAAMLPALLTAMIIVFVFTFVQNKLGTHIDAAVQWIVVQVLSVWRDLPLDVAGSDEAWDSVKGIWEAYHLWWIGFVLAFVAIYILGRFVASFVGRSAWRVIEQALTRAPVISQIYPNVKQVTDFLLSEKKLSFSRVVAVEYPRKGVWSLGLVTGSGMRRLSEALGSELLTVFVPSSPTPVTGYTITVRRDEAIDLPLSIDEALRFTVSGGVLIPPAQRSEGLEEAITRKALPQADGTQREQPGREAEAEQTEQEKGS